MGSCRKKQIQWRDIKIKHMKIIFHDDAHLIYFRKTGQRLDNLYDYIVSVSNNASFRVPTGTLNDV